NRILGVEECSFYGFLIKKGGLIMIPMSISKVVCSPSAVKIRRQMDKERKKRVGGSLNGHLIDENKSTDFRPSSIQLCCGG
ncbi:hypothetical protein KJ590_00395, partial [Patescibacteria group bacterium]|nr:hypothetical protein [Patescibacteria group bacterium]